MVRRCRVFRSATNHAWGRFHVVTAPHCMRLLSPCASSSYAFLENSIRRHAVNYRRVFLLVVLLLGVALLQRTRAVCAGDEWQPISPEEGRKQADIEIPFVKARGSIHSIKARTIRPDGSIANFDGKVYDKTIVKAKGFKYLAKTFTLPDVQVGSIVEYHYMNDLGEGYVYDSEWILSEELFTRRAKFTLKPNADFALNWSWPVGLPAGTKPPVQEAGAVRLETQNVPDKFWKKMDKKWNGHFEDFIGKRKAMEQAAAGIVSPSDSPEVKLQKIYARVQQVRNTSWETVKTEQEQKREKQKDINNVEDLWKQGYGNARQINWLFVALARAAGLEAYSVYISARSEYFFNPKLMNTSQLNGDVVLVKLNGKDVYCDPATRFAPFGMLSWPETGVQGLKLDKDGGSWVTTTLPASSASQVARKADLKLTDTGSLEGKLTFTFSGLEALWRRIEERNEDQANRKKFLEDQVKEYIPVGIDVELINKPDWASSAPTLVAEYDLKVQGWATGAGKRVLVPVGLFSAPEKHLFEHANRVHPIYFQFSSGKIDDVTIELPLGWQVSNLPTEQTNDQKVAVYHLKAENSKGTLHVTRQLNSDLLMVDAKSYPALRNFYQVVRTGDDQQIVVQPGTSAASN